MHRLVGSWRSKSAAWLVVIVIVLAGCSGDSTNVNADAATTIADENPTTSSSLLEPDEAPAASADDQADPGTPDSTTGNDDTSGDANELPPTNRTTRTDLPGEFQAGTATFYDADGSGNCSFDSSPDDLMVAAMNQQQYAGSQACGASVEVKGPSGTVTVRIVDRCPECPAGYLDLSAEAFAAIANPTDGVVAVEWRVVPGNTQGNPIGYHFKEGSSQFWTAVQVRNHRHPVASFEYHRGDGSWVAVKREMYNYFVEPAGMGPGPYTFRITDIYGNMVTDSGVALRLGAPVAGQSQF